MKKLLSLFVVIAATCAPSFASHSRHHHYGHKGKMHHTGYHLHGPHHSRHHHTA